MFELPTRITKTFLLNKKPAEAYFEFYLGVPVKKGLFVSPPCLRKDSHPTCAFYKNSKGDLIFKDFAGISGDFVTIVMEIFKVSYYKALNIIANDFGYIKLDNYKVNIPKLEYTGSILSETEKAKIQVEIKEFSDKELSWWNSFGISKKTLELYKVFSIKHIFLNGTYFNSSSEKTPIYGYYGGLDVNKQELWRLYMPTKLKYRFLSNWSGNKLQGVKQLLNTTSCIITKSMKDVMLLHEFGINAVSPISETIVITESQFNKMSTKFNRIIVLFDNDLAGVKGAKKYKKEYNTTCIFIKRKYAKDISDLYKKVSATVFWKIIEEVNIILSDTSISQTKHFYIFNNGKKDN